MLARCAVSILVPLCVVAGCTASKRFVPASGVERATGYPWAALARHAGVTVVADAEAAAAWPPSATHGVTAIHVRIRNDSDEPIAVRYLSFRLESDRGDERRPLPPIPMERARPAASALAPRPEADGFRYAPYYRDLLDDESVCWTGGLVLDPYFYDRYLAWREDLPTEPMVQRALPEGVLEPGGWVAGFLYFDAVDGDARRVTLRVDFDQPLGAERIATITIPFVGSTS